MGPGRKPWFVHNEAHMFSGEISSNKDISPSAAARVRTDRHIILLTIVLLTTTNT